MSGASLDFYDSIAAIRETVVAYQVGLTRIERDFAEARSRIEKSVNRLSGGSAIQGTIEADAQHQEKSLRQQATDIERQIAGIDRRIATAVQGIAAVESAMRSLAEEKSELERQISDRWLIVKIYYFFAENKDEAKRQCEALQCQLDASASRKSALEKTKRGFEKERQHGEARRSELERSQEHIYRKLGVIEKAKGWSEEQKRRFSEERMRVSDNRQRRKANWQTNFADQWERTLFRVERTGSDLRRHQPSFTDLDLGQPATTEVPRELLLGSQRVSFEGYSCLVPHSIPFPFACAIALPEDNAAQLRLAHHLLLRMLSAIPPGQLQLTLIDPLKLGKSAGPFLPLLNVEALVPQQRVLTRSEEIESALSKLTGEVEDLIQRRFNDRAPGWSEFNAQNPENPLPYRVLLLFDVPEQLSDRSLWFLERLCENGPRCGVLPVFAIEASRIEDRRFERFRAAIENLSMRLDALLRGPDDEGDGLSFAYEPEQWPHQDMLERIIGLLVERHASKARFTKSMSDLWSEFTIGETTIGGFEIPIGWNPGGEIVSLRLGATDSEHHALLAGKTGSGKSNLLHVIIHSLCERYAPGEVGLYLLDYKESTEFAVYANPPLPHARLVATESDPEYGVTVLEHLADELERRGRIFKAKGVVTIQPFEVRASDSPSSAGVRIMSRKV